VTRGLRAVLFDAGNTLISLDYERLAGGVSAAVGRSIPATVIRSRAAEAAAALERGTGTDRERATSYLEALFLLSGVRHEELEAVRAEVVRLHRERHLWIGVEPGTREVLERLRAGGLRLGVVSNSDGKVDAALAAAGLRPYFEVVVDSTLAGVEKPDPRIFDVALEAMGIDAGDAVYVGDVYEVDVVGARRAGLQPVLLDPNGFHSGRDVPTVRGLAELPQLLAAGFPGSVFTQS
jgi:putative hydrolase of the HAD superfamily